MIIFTLKYSPQSYYIGLLKSRRVTLLRQGKDENKRKGMTIVNKVPWLHYLDLKHSFAHEIAREKMSFHVLLTVIFYPGAAINKN